MNFTIKLFIIFCISFSAQINAQTTFINYGSNWTYYDLANEPVDQATQNWTDINFDDTSWANGNTHLGYGDGDEVTVINSSTLTAYVRHEFSVANTVNFDNLDFNLTYDDGAVIYLNGAEIWRVNMPSGTISYGTFAASTSSENATASINLANTLINGTNVLSVEIHQRSTTSSDISFDFRLIANPPGVVNVTRGPYLQKSTDQGMTLRWRTSTATESVVHYGTTQSNLNLTAQDLTPKTEHEVSISGLSANTQYFYDIANLSTVLINGAADLYFKTYPTVGSTQPVRAWILGDCGTANANQRAVRDAYYNYIGSNHTDMILFLGDNAYNDGTDSEYQTAVFENMYEAKLQNSVSWSCLGNHDGHSADSQSQTGPYYDIFSFPKAGESGGLASGTEAYYSFDYGNIHFISLDSYETDRTVGGAMYNWCELDIQNTTADWIVAFWHHPPYTKGSHDSDTETALIDMRQNFLPMLETNAVDLVLSGHSHSYERSYLLNGHYGNSNSFDSNVHTVGTTGFGDGKQSGNGAYEKTTTGAEAGDGVVYITTGSSGKITNAPLDHEAMYYSVAQLGSCVLEINGDTMDVKFVRETGSIDDFFSIIKDPMGCIVGASCDDGDACTTNDIYDANCICLGTFTDSDGDGVCDADDQCPGMDDALIGTTCDDQDNCTVNDVYNNSCGCVGIYQDTDGDGYCVGNDPDDNDGCNPDNNSSACNPCNEIITDGFESGFGNWNDGGNDCARSASNANTGTYSIRIRDNSGASSSMYSDNLALDGAAEVKIEFSFIANSMEINEDFFLEISTNGGSNYSVYQEWNSGVEFSNGVRYNEEITILNYGFTNITVFRFRCDASGNNDQVYIDDVVISSCNISCTEGDPCDDGDICTTGDARDINCNCVGIFQDNDGDGVCDSLDQCPGQDDNLIGTSCDDADNCTVNDIYDNTCNCSGTYQDNDGDGFCVGNDPDDSDGCNPDPLSPACSACTSIISDGFESGFGNWNDGGNDCARNASNANTGSYSIRLRDNSGASSSMYSDNLALDGATEVKFAFSFTTNSMENNEDFFLDISTDGGSNYSVYQEWNSGVEFSNGIRYNEEITILNYGFTNSSVFRLRCDASANNDQVYIDDVVVSNCSVSQNKSSSSQTRSNMIDLKGINIYPIPASDKFYLDLTPIRGLSANLVIFNLEGQSVIKHQIGQFHNDVIQIEIPELKAGMYSVQIISSDNQLYIKKLVVTD